MSEEIIEEDCTVRARDGTPMLYFFMQDLNEYLGRTVDASSKMVLLHRRSMESIKQLKLGSQKKETFANTLQTPTLKPWKATFAVELSTWPAGVSTEPRELDTLPLWEIFQSNRYKQDGSHS